MPKEVWTARLVGTGWVVELGSLNGRVLRQFPFRHGVRLLLRILSLLSFFSVDSTQDRLGRLPNDSRNIPPLSLSSILLHLFPPFISLHALPMDISLQIY